MARNVQPEKGLYKNGRFWWVRSVRSPAGPTTKRLSTGTDDTARANRIVGMLQDLREVRTQWVWIDRALAGLSLDQIYNHFSASTLHLLEAELTAGAEAAKDTDVEPWVKRWDDEHLAVLVANGKIRNDRRALLIRYVRAFLPEGQPFPRSRFTEDFVKTTLFAIKHPKRGTPLESPTRLKYFEALRLFYNWARKTSRAGITVNPFADEDGDQHDWQPSQNDPRTVAWGFQETQDVLARLAGDRRAFAALVLGSGIEFGAAINLQARDVGPGGDETGRWVTAHARTNGKNGARKSRKIFVRKWAWDIFYPHAKNCLPTASLWQTINPVNRGRDVRDDFYWAQERAGLITKPAKSKSGKWLWAAVGPHDLHDARHTYINITALGLDNERRLSSTEQRHQLGHTDDTMIKRVYGKLNIEQTLKLIELAEAAARGRREAQEQQAAEGGKR